MTSSLLLPVARQQLVPVPELAPPTCHPLSLVQAPDDRPAAQVPPPAVEDGEDEEDAHGQDEEVAEVARRLLLRRQIVHVLLQVDHFVLELFTDTFPALTVGLPPVVITSHLPISRLVALLVTVVLLLLVFPVLISVLFSFLHLFLLLNLVL